MAKYKKKKILPTTSLGAEHRVSPKNDAQKSTDNSTDKFTDKSTDKSVERSIEKINDAGDAKKPKRMASGSLKLQFAGDLILVKNSQKALSGLFKRYAALFEELANTPKEQRALLYKIMTGLMLTSHAKKSMVTEERRRLFDLKNQLFLAVANDRTLRRQVEFKYLVSKNFRVISYCESCQLSNAEHGLERHKWKYCKQCQVDHNFYNLLSMETRFPQGFARIFISYDQLPNLEHFKLPRRIKNDAVKEEAVINQFHYNTRNLDAIELSSVIALQDRLVQKAPVTRDKSFSS